MRKRKNRIEVYFNDRELERLNRMVDKTNLNREQFIREMLAGFSIREAPPAPLMETLRLLRSAAGNMSSMASRTMLREITDRELLLQTVNEIRTCANAISEQCMPIFKEEKRK